MIPFSLSRETEIVCEYSIRIRIKYLFFQQFCEDCNVNDVMTSVKRVFFIDEVTDASLAKGLKINGCIEKGVLGKIS